MKGMLLAAGHGTRFRPHTKRFAKVALPLLNLPLLSYPLYLLESLSLKHLVINTHHLADSIHKAVNRLIPAQYPIAFSHEAPNILDSAGGIGQARQQLVGDGSFIVANSDVVLIPSHAKGLDPFLKFHTKHKPLASLYLCAHSQVGREYGGIWIKDESVKGIGKTAIPGCNPLHFTGFMILSDSILQRIPEGHPSHIFNDVLLPAIKEGCAVKAFVDVDAGWFDAGDEAHFLNTTKLLLDILAAPQNPHHNFLKNLFTRFGRNPKAISETCWLDTKAQVETTIPTGTHVLIGKNSLVESGAKLMGFCVIGDHLKIPSGCELKNAVIANDKELHKNTIIHNKLII